MGGTRDEVVFNFELIPIIIQNLFGGNMESLLEMYVLTSRKIKTLTFTDYMMMTPVESRYSVEFIVDQEQQGQSPSEDEDIFAEG